MADEDAVLRSSRMESGASGIGLAGLQSSYNNRISNNGSGHCLSQCGICNCRREVLMYSRSEIHYSRFLETRSLTKIQSHMINMLPVLNLATCKTAPTMENQKVWRALDVAEMPEQNTETFESTRHGIEHQFSKVRSMLYCRILDIWVSKS